MENKRSRRQEWDDYVLVNKEAGEKFNTDPMFRHSVLEYLTGASPFSMFLQFTKVGEELRQQHQKLLEQGAVTNQIIACPECPKIQQFR